MTTVALFQARHDHDGHCSGQSTLHPGYIEHAIVCDDCHALVQPLGSVPYTLTVEPRAA